MSKIKGNFKFTFNRKIGNEWRIPFNYCLRPDGQKDGLRYCIESQIGIKITKVEYLKNDDVFIQFEDELTAEQTTLLNSIVNTHKQKTSFSPIELEAKTWADAQFPIRDVLPVIEGNLKVLYDAATWEDLTFIEKQIFAYWRVCTDQEALEVYTQEELDNLRWYKIYKYLTDNQKTVLTKQDIYKVPKQFDFTIDFEEKFYKRRYPFVKGRPEKNEYYADYNPMTFEYDNMFAVINFSFVDQPGNLLILQKIANLSWVYNSGEVDLVNIKDIGQVYHPINDITLRMQEAEMKRENVYFQLRGNVLGMIIATEPGLTEEQAIATGTMFLEKHKVASDNWIRLGLDYQQGMIDAVANEADAQFSWLDNIIDGNGTTIRMYIINEVTIH
jgi:hypothetical protein